MRGGPTGQTQHPADLRGRHPEAVGVEDEVGDALLRYEIIYSPKSPALHVDMETEVEADFHRVEGRFVTFYARQTE
ncbi:hypothetical protein GCM10025786_34680 [Nocardioides caeni]